ncbi:hypothetical protein BaRGS_00023706 [Batillaria attramentaria]|uniref:Uncharacterized protein n=1 Tax=Batillaria attramentaria TaxID=370345 RepID=A0ABD0KDE3_9CAEN
MVPDRYLWDGRSIPRVVCTPLACTHCLGINRSMWLVSSVGLFQRNRLETKTLYPKLEIHTTEHWSTLTLLVCLGSWHSFGRFVSIIYTTAFGD